MHELIHARDVSFAYAGPEVLSGVSLAVRSGRLLGILGPNGSGKTTLLRLLGGLRRPLAGSVTLDGVDLSRLSRAQVAHRMAMVPQETQLAFDYSVLEIVMMGRYPHLGPFEIEGPADLAAGRAALATTGTLELAERSFMTLSGGEKQRVIIASALAQLDVRAEADPRDADASRTPQILLLDEPTASLDLGYQVEIASLLRQLNRRHGLTTIVSTHDLNFAASVCQELVLLRNGRVIAAGETTSVLEPRAIAALYDVEVDVQPHVAAGHLTVVPIRRTVVREP